MDNINIWDISCNPVIDFSVNELINDTRITLIRCFNKNPIFDGNLIGLIESYDHLDDFTIIQNKHYRYFNQIKIDRGTIVDLYNAKDLASIRYVLKQGIPISYIRELLLMAYCDVHTDIIDLLIQHDLSNLNTFFFIAINREYTYSARYLLKYNPTNLNECLQYVVEMNNAILTRLLIKAGANNLDECLIIAIDKKFKKLIRILKH
jgi:hypothetical protein